MKEIEELLREARRDRGITLSEISERTKIQVRYLEALESGDHDQFPGEVYLKGALRSYAEAVGLDPGKVLDLYRAWKGEPAPEEEAPATLKKRRAARRETREGPSFIYGLIILALLVLAGGYWFAHHYLQKAPPGEEPPAGESEIAEPEDPNGSGAEEPPAGEEPLPAEGPEIAVDTDASTAGETLFQVSAVDRLELELTCQDRCWIDLVADGKKQFEPRIFGRGEVIRQKAAEEIRFRLGYPRGVGVTINGIEVRESADKIDPHNFIFIRK